MGRRQDPKILLIFTKLCNFLSRLKNSYLYLFIYMYMSLSIESRSRGSKIRLEDLLINLTH